MLTGIVTGASELGGRLYQEDRYIIEQKKISDTEKGWLLAVADGHRSDDVAESCCANLSKFFDAALKKNQRLHETIRIAFVAIAKATRKMISGSTLSMVYVSETQHKAFVAVIGDSPVIIRAAGGKVNESPNHNARVNIKERDAAIARGGVYKDGFIWDIKKDTGLQVSRALGDWPILFVSNKPDVYSISLDYESFVLIVSDGVSDPSHLDGGYVEYLTSKLNDGANASGLVTDAVARRTMDNATAVLWRSAV